MKAWERLINYVTVRTPSDEESETVPSSVCQFNLARKLEKEMKELGLTEVVLDDKCYLYGKLPATEGKKEIPALGFIAQRVMKTVLRSDLSHIWIQFLIFVIMRSDRWLPKIMMAGIWYLAQADWY